MYSSKQKTADAAVGRWAAMLPLLGVDPKYLSKKHGPCPFCGGTDRYRFDDRHGRGNWICSHCGAGDGFQLVQRTLGLSFSEVARRVDQLVGTIPSQPRPMVRTEEEKVRIFQRVWQESKAVVRDDPIWRYLNRRLGQKFVPPGLRLHQGLRYIDENGRNLGTFPAMLGKIQYPDGRDASIHRTYLTENGQKAPVPQPKKLMVGRAAVTGCVRLGEPGMKLGIAEGIETALAASTHFNTPVWAATSAALLEAWVPPRGVSHVLIAGDNDENYIGHAAAYKLAYRLRQRGIVVEVHIPLQPGKDWADFLV